jgi:membrane associated rhomboid family serine protease
MLSDRPYMRDDYPSRSTSPLVWLICTIVAGFVVQNVFWRWFGPRAGLGFDHAFQLSIAGLRSGYLWTLFSYAFLHSMSNFLHLLGNLFALFFIGREVQNQLGGRQFLTLFFGGVLAGSLFWSLINWSQGGAVIGASAGVAATLIVFACIHPNQRITLLLFFILPVTLKPKYLAFGLLGIDLMGFLFWELTGGRSPMGYAHSAHLGGMALGWFFYRQVYRRAWQTPDRAPKIELPAWLKRSRQATAPAYRVNVAASHPAPKPTRDELRVEVDRILDKINSQGFGSLTPAEKARLDEARELLSRK